MKFKQPVHYIVLEDCLEAVDVATARRDRLEAHIVAALPASSLAPVVQALQALRGVAMVNAHQLPAIKWTGTRNGGSAGWGSAINRSGNS